MGTLFGIVISALITVSPFALDGTAPLVAFALLIVTIPLLLLFIHGISLAFAWTPLQKAEQNLTSRILEMFQKDRFFQWFNYWLIFFIFASFVLAVELIFFDLFQHKYIFSIWSMFFGLSLDLLFHFYKKITLYLNPFAVADLFTKKANESVQEEHEQELCDWIDALAEIGIKTIKSGSSSLCMHCIDSLQKITKHFLQSQKSISHHNQDSETKALGITDKVSFTLFYIFQRLESIYHHAIELKMEPICSTMISAMGKIAIDAAKYDLSMASYPLHFLAKFATQAQDHHFPEIGVKASLTLLEVSKTILNEIDLTYSDLKDPFLNIIHHLDELAKNAFRHDKAISISWLTKPIRDFKELFSYPKVEKHQDTHAIIQSTDLVLSEFASLELVMRTIPPISIVDTEEHQPSPPQPLTP